MFFASATPPVLTPSMNAFDVSERLEVSSKIVLTHTRTVHMNATTKSPRRITSAELNSTTQSAEPHSQSMAQQSTTASITAELTRSRSVNDE